MFLHEYTPIQLCRDSENENLVFLWKQHIFPPFFLLLFILSDFNLFILLTYQRLWIPEGHIPFFPWFFFFYTIHLTSLKPLFFISSLRNFYDSNAFEKFPWKLSEAMGKPNPTDVRWVLLGRCILKGAFTKLLVSSSILLLGTQLWCVES